MLFQVRFEKNAFCIDAADRSMAVRVYFVRRGPLFVDLLFTFGSH